MGGWVRRRLVTPLLLTLIACAATTASAFAQTASATSAQAAEYEKQGEYPQAESAWQAITVSNPKNAQAWAHLGLARALEGKYAEAVPAYRKALQLDPKAPGVELDLGLALFKQEHFKEAIPAFKAAVAESPKEVKPKLLLGMSYYAAAQYADAVAPLQFAVNASPDNIQLRTTLAQSCLWAKQYSCALEQYKQILLLNPESAQAYMLAGEAEDGLGDTAQAIAQFRAAEKVAPHEPDLHFGLGYLLWKSHQFEDAEAEFKLELEENPEHPQALTYLGDIAIKHGDETAAMSYLKRAVAQPEKALHLAYVDLGILNAEQNRNEEAEADFQRAIQLAPDEVDAHWRLAHVYQALGKKNEAIAELAKVNQLHKTKDEGLVRQMNGGPPAQPQPQ